MGQETRDKRQEEREKERRDMGEWMVLKFFVANLFLQWCWTTGRGRNLLVCVGVIWSERERERE